MEGERKGGRGEWRTRQQLLTHDGGLPAAAVQLPPVVAQAGEAAKGEGATGGRHVQVVLMQQEGNSHAPLALLACVVEGDGALPFAVLAPVLKLKVFGYYDESEVVFALLNAFSNDF